MFDNILWNMDGAGIEAESFRRIEAECTHSRFSPEEWRVARRLIHTTADFSIADTLVFRHDPITAGLDTLRRGVPLYCDSNMIKSGISEAKLKNFNTAYSRDSIYCHVADADVAAAALAANSTRALAAVRKAANILPGSIFLCGNAPLALAGLLRMISENQTLPPALIIAMPVGFVNVVESKELLRHFHIPHICIEGRRGGSPLAVATLHAIMENA